MNYLIFDTETTGLGKQDEVIQFSGLLVNNDFKLQRGFNWYCDTQHPISQGALDTHGITKKMLHDLSDGKTFEDYWFQMMKTLDFDHGLTFIGWNVSFDIRLINQTLNNNGLDEYNFGQKTKTLRLDNDIYNFDLMEPVASMLVNRERLKLEHASKMIKMSREELQKRYAKLAAKFKKVATKDFHNSLYDTYITYEIFEEFARKLRY